jgi:cytochrome c553
MNARSRLLTPLLCLALCACGPGVPASAASAPERPSKLGMCASCHGVDGIAIAPGNPHLAGQDEAYLRLSLTKYKTGERVHPPMQAVAGALSEADIDAMSRWYAAQPRGGQRAAAAAASAAATITSAPTPTPAEGG